MRTVSFLVILLQVSLVFAARTKRTNNITTIRDHISAPLIGITYHDDQNVDQDVNIYLYYLNGSAVGGDDTNPTPLINPTSGGNAELSNLRALHSLGGGTVLFNEGKTSRSTVWRLTGACNGDGTLPNYNGVLTSLSQDAQLDHPYGLTILQDTVLVSNQDNGNIVQLSSTSGSPTATTVATVTNPRGITIDGASRLWVCQDKDEQVSVFDTSSWQLVQTISTPRPIGVRYDAKRNYIVVTNDDKDNSAVVVFNATSYQIVSTITDPQFSHGAGIAQYNGVFYVLSQGTSTLFQLDLDAFTLTALNTNLFGTPEQIDVITC